MNLRTHCWSVFLVRPSLGWTWKYIFNFKVQLVWRLCNIPGHGDELQGWQEAWIHGSAWLQGEEKPPASAIVGHHWKAIARLQLQIPKFPPLQWTCYQIRVQRAPAMKHLAISPSLLRFVTFALILDISFSLAGFGTDWSGEIRHTEHHQGRARASHTHL